MKETKKIIGLTFTTETLNRVYNFFEENIDHNNSIQIEITNEKTVRYFQKEEFLDKIKLLKNQPSQIKFILKPTKVSNNYFIATFRISGEIELLGNIDTDEQIFLSNFWEIISMDDEEYPTYIKNIISSYRLRKFILNSIIGFSIILLASLIMIIYAKNVGVNLSNPSLIPKGNQHLIIIENAIKSDSINVKLNALLRTELVGYTNANDFINKSVLTVTYSSIALVVLGLLLLIIIQLSKRFPKLYFNLNEFHNKTLVKFQKQRDNIISSVLIAFIINLVSGLILALLV